MKTITARINAALQKLGREERMYRAREGYYYVSGGEYHSMAGLYVYRLEHASAADLKLAVDYVNEVLENVEAGVRLANV